MLGIYWGTFLFGGILILSSIVLGGGDGDADGDMDKDLSFDKDLSIDVEDLDGEAGDYDSMGWLPFLSLRFWTFFTGLFGLSGIIMTELGSGFTTTLVTSSVMGIGLAYPIAYLFQHLKRDSVTSNTSSKNYEQEIATTLLPMSPNGQGKIRISMAGELVDIIASNPTNESIAQGSEVLIVSMENGIALVSPMDRNSIADQS